MNLAPLMAVPLLLAQGYTLRINHSNGTTTEIPTEEITDMVFLKNADNPNPEDPDPNDPQDKNKLSTPYANVLPLGDDACIVAWSRVENAADYSWQLNDNEPVTVTGTQVTVNNLVYGENTIRIWANPEPGSQYSKSDPRVLSYTGKLAVNVTVLSVDQTSVKASVSVNKKGACLAGIVPATVTDMSERMEYVKSNAAAQKVSFNSDAVTAQDLNFKNLTPDTQYNIVVFLTDEPESARITKVVTATDKTPGSKATLFAPGVTATSGWVDVDKVGDLSKYGWQGQDNLMCWACSISGIIQWWLNDYKTKTGRDYELVYPIKETSKCYSTPVMDLYVDYYRHDAGAMFNTLKWFFRPVAVNFYDENGNKLIDESLPHWQGGFGGMTEDEIQSLLIVNKASSEGHNIPEYDYSKLFDAKGKTAAEIISIFSEKIVHDLREGPIAMCIGATAGNSVHGISIWGADYEVLNDGSFKVNKLYVGENDPISGNVRGGLNNATITYGSESVMLEMASTGGPKEVKTFFGIRGYQGK